MCLRSPVRAFGGIRTCLKLVLSLEVTESWVFSLAPCMFSLLPCGISAPGHIALSLDEGFVLVMNMKDTSALAVTAYCFVKQKWP